MKVRLLTGRTLTFSPFLPVDLSKGQQVIIGLGTGWEGEQLHQPLLRLNAFDRKAGSLIKTLHTWFANNCHPTLKAKAIHIHRNTLDYRLQKITELTGLDLNNTDDGLLLYVALQLKEKESG